LFGKIGLFFLLCAKTRSRIKIAALNETSLFFLQYDGNLVAIAKSLYKKTYENFVTKFMKIRANIRICQSSVFPGAIDAAKIAPELLLKLWIS